MPDDFYFYLEDQYKISNRLSANIGLHYAIFKINIRSQHKEKFLSNKGVWTFSKLQEGDFGDDLIGDVVKGLTVKKYKQKNRFGTFDLVSFIMPNIKTGSKKSDLK